MYTHLKTIAFIAALLLIVFGNTTRAMSQECIEIEDRQHLPADVFGILKDNTAILLGEVHGTNETPQFVEGMVDLWLRSAQKVVLALEINQDYQGIIDEYLQTGNDTLIREMPFFKRDFQDGRSSVAIANLIRAMYRKPDLKLICLDESSAAVSHAKRDSIMGANLAAALQANPGWKLISLTGNVHNKLELGGFGYPMGYWLLNNQNLKLGKDKIASIDIVFESGSSWNCRGRNGEPLCKEYPQGNLAGDRAKKYPFNNFFNYSDQEKVLFTRTVSSSPPLKGN